MPVVPAPRSSSNLLEAKSNFGVASVYIDNEFVQQVNVNGAAAVGKLLFQKADLPAGSHTIRIVCDTPVIDLDYLTYTTNA